MRQMFAGNITRGKTKTHTDGDQQKSRVSVCSQSKMEVDRIAVSGRLRLIANAPEVCSSVRRTVFLCAPHVCWFSPLSVSFSWRWISRCCKDFPILHPKKKRIAETLGRRPTLEEWRGKDLFTRRHLIGVAACGTAVGMTNGIRLMEDVADGDSAHSWHLAGS